MKIEIPNNSILGLSIAMEILDGGSNDELSTRIFKRVRSELLSNPEYGLEEQQHLLETQFKSLIDKCPFANASAEHKIQLFLSKDGEDNPKVFCMCECGLKTPKVPLDKMLDLVNIINEMKE